MELTRCPECGLVAEVVGRDVWPSTDGPVEHVHVRCVDRHRFLLPVALLGVSIPSEPVVAERRAPSTPGLHKP
ncbi:MAG TPA: hypothetical protein VFI44_04310 [Ornithinibacter sp.]|nr:hypothetical protein [Ornithinibacter sp.]